MMRTVLAVRSVVKTCQVHNGQIYSGKFESIYLETQKRNGRQRYHWRPAKCWWEIHIHSYSQIEIAVEMEVLLKNTAKKQRKGGKLWLGPYIIHRCIGKRLYELSRDGNVVKKEANIAWLKIYVKRASEDDMQTSIVFNVNNQCFYLQILFVPEIHHWVPTAW